MESKDNSFIEKENFLITSVSKIKKTPINIETNTEQKPIKINETARITNSKSCFPEINYKTSFPNERNNYFKLKTNKTHYKNIKKQKIDIGLKKMELFIHPINKTVLEINGIKAMKENLIKQKFIDLHKFKLQINPDNYYHNYGLNKYIIITNNNRNKRNHSFNFHFNNVSSYNNLILKEEEDKINMNINKSKKKLYNNVKICNYKNNLILKEEEDKINMNINKKKLYKNIKLCNYKNNISVLKNFPCRLNARNPNDHIINSFTEENGLLENTNSLWRGKNINDIINNKTNLNFFQNFIKNSKHIGKLKSLE